MIHRAKFQNFKALRDVEVTFDSRLTVLVGPNGSGKTSVLEGIDFVCQATGQRFEGHNRFYPNQWTSIGATTAQVIELNTEVKGGWGLGSRATQQPGHQPGIEFVRSRLGPGRGTAVQPTQQEKFDVTQSMRATSLLRLEPAKLAYPSKTTSKPPVMANDGGGLASTLAYLALNQPERFAGVVLAARQVVPTIERLRFDKVPHADFGDEVLFDFRGASGVRAAHASSGTLLTLGLLTAILGPERPQIVLLDDIDNGLHPKAQKELVEVLRKLLGQHPDLQVIATTHSLYILHWLEFNEVRLLTLNDEGATVCGRLDQHPDYERWKDAMTPGEFWTHVGEDWLLKKQPEPVGAVS